MKALNVRTPGKPGPLVTIVLLVDMDDRRAGDQFQIPQARAVAFARAGFARLVQPRK